MIYDLIEVMYKPTGEVTLVDGIEVPVMGKIEGYHVNMLPPLLDKLRQYIVEPTHKQRVFAGRDDTIYLKFKDRDEWLSLGVENVEDLV